MQTFEHNCILVTEKIAASEARIRTLERVCEGESTVYREGRVEASGGVINTLTPALEPHSVENALD